MYSSAFHFVSSGLSRFTSEANDYHAVSGCQINRGKSLNSLLGNVFFVCLLVVKLGVRILPSQHCTCLCEDNMKHLECKFTKTHKAELKLCRTMMNVLPLTCWHPNKHSWPTLVLCLFFCFALQMQSWTILLPHYCITKEPFYWWFYCQSLGFQQMMSQNA